MIRHLELMRMHVEALFTHDTEGSLLRVNDPNGALAPRFFLGRTLDGALWRFRQDVDAGLRDQLEAAVVDDLAKPNAVDAPIDASAYIEILGRAGPVGKAETGPAFCFPDDMARDGEAVLITDDTAHLLRPHLPEWLPDVRLSQPLVAMTVDGAAVAVCCSVRITAAAHEAGVETVRAYRGRGLARRVVVSWAHAVRAMDRVPLYSTSWRNDASRSVAKSLALIQFGSDLHIA